MSYLDRLIIFLKSDTFSLCIALAIFSILCLSVYQYITSNTGTWSNYYFKPYTNNSRIIPQTKQKDSKGETESRRVLESIFKVPFSKARPNFLNNPVTGGNFNLELDCYNPNLKLAVEYQGQQHYKFTPFFHKTNEAFINQKYRDELKRRMCKDNMITLIEIPYTVKIENIKTYLLNELLNHGFVLK